MTRVRIHSPATFIEHTFYCLLFLEKTKIKKQMPGMAHPEILLQIWPKCFSQHYSMQKLVLQYWSHPAFEPSLPASGHTPVFVSHSSLCSSTKAWLGFWQNSFYGRFYQSLLRVLAAVKSYFSVINGWRKVLYPFIYLPSSFLNTKV